MGGQKTFRCPGCGAVFNESELWYTEGACPNYGDTCTWEDSFDELEPEAAMGQWRGDDWDAEDGYWDQLEMASDYW